MEFAEVMPDRRADWKGIKPLLPMEEMVSWENKVWRKYRIASRKRDTADRNGFPIKRFFPRAFYLKRLSETQVMMAPAGRERE